MTEERQEDLGLKTVIVKVLDDSVGARWTFKEWEEAGSGVWFNPGPEELNLLYKRGVRDGLALAGRRLERQSKELREAMAKLKEVLDESPVL